MEGGVFNNMKTDYKTIKVDVKDGIALLTLDNPPVNQMSPHFVQDMVEAFSEAYEDDQVKAIIITGTGGNFIAGADITRLQTVKTRDEIYPVAMAAAKFHGHDRDGDQAVHRGHKRKRPGRRA